MLKLHRNIALSLMFLAMPALAGTPITENELFKAVASEGKSCVPLAKRNESLCGGTYLKDDQLKQKEYEKSVICNVKDQQRYVATDENYEVALRQVFVNKFSEYGWRAILGRKKGEIAIVANVMPIDDKTPMKFDSAAWKKARVVYYSPNVGEGHFLPMDNLVVFGPSSYHDQGLMVQFYLLELDEQDKGQQLIEQLASLGKNYVSAPAPVVNILNVLAKSLISQNRDDLEIKYETRLNAPLRNSNGELLTIERQGLALQYGYYVVAQQFRQSWTSETPSFPANPYFNYKDARVYGDAACTQELRTHNYLVFEVKNNPQATPVGIFELYDELMQRLTQETDNKSKSTAEILQILASEKDISDAYLSAVQLMKSVEELRWSNVKTDGKKLKAEATRLTPTLKARLKDNFSLLATSIAKQQKNEVPNVEAPFTRKQSQLLLTRLIQIAGDEAPPWTLGEDKLLDHISAFFYD